MLIRLKVGTETMRLFLEGQPSQGDTLVLPGTMFRPPLVEDQTVVVTTLHPRWESDDDGALVPTFEATIR